MPADFSSIQLELQRGTLVVASDAALALAIREQVLRGQRQAACETPAVLSWSAWLHQLWQQLQGLALRGAGDHPGQILNHLQELAIWEDLVAESQDQHPLLQLAPTARALKQAWALVNTWRLPMDHEAWSDSREGQVFRDWSRAYVRRCQRDALVDLSVLPELLAAAVRDGRLVLPARIMLAGFDRPGSQLRAFSATLEQAGVTLLHWLPGTGRCARVRRHAFADQDSEFQAVANWAAEQLAGHGQETGRVAILLPDLAASRDALLDHLDRVLDPTLVLNPGRSRLSAYRLGSDEKLAVQSMVAAALRLLRLGNGIQSQEDISFLLRSPWLLGGNSESSARAAVDFELRSRRSSGMSLARLRALLAESHAHACGQLILALQRWLAVADQVPHTASASQWSEWFSRLLNALGWPGDAEPGPDEVLVLQAWRQAVEAWSGLDLVCQPMAKARALSRLRRHVQGLSMPSALLPARLVLGDLGDAISIQAEQVWVAGLHDGKWPPPMRANAFIPLRLQRLYGVQGCHPSDTLQQARRCMDYLQHQAHELILSHPAGSAAETLEASPLVRSVALSAAPEQAGATAVRQLLFAARQRQYYRDQNAPAIVDGEHVPGGTGIFRAQSACPFQAFASYRLQAIAPEALQEGLDARDRGSLVHRCLQQLWLQLGNQAALLALSRQELDVLVESVATQTVGEFGQFMPQRLPAVAASLEVRRLVRLCLEFLELDRQRPPFQIESAEQDTEAQLGGIHFKTRIDRVDRLDNGHLAIIDYKTGTVSADAWLDERPEEPQMPLYAVCAEGAVDAVMYATLKPGHCRYVGVAEHADEFPSVRAFLDTPVGAHYADWSELLNGWLQKLVQLGEAFRAGRCEVDPRQWPQTCGYCDLGPLCRVRDLPTAGQQHDDD